jgi:FdhD protein
MRTPGNDEELAVGFLVSETLIAPSDVLRVSFGDPLHTSQPENHILVRLRTSFDAARIPARTTVATASCGICGKASLDDVVQRLGRVEKIPRISGASLLHLPDQLRAAQDLFESTGGLHAAAAVSVAADGSLSITTVREDVGRHNAVDKLIGEAALRGALPLASSLLMLSGRCSFELVQKAAAAGFAAIACVGAPSSLAVETAERLGICLIGFLRERSFNVYTEQGVVQP